MIKKNILALIVFILSYNKYIAQQYIETNIISGIITNNKSVPLENVIVSLKNRNVQTFSNSKGTFNIEISIADISDTLKFHQLGYSSYVICVKDYLNEFQNSKHIILIESGIELQEVNINFDFWNYQNIGYAAKPISILYIQKCTDIYTFFPNKKPSIPSIISAIEFTYSARFFDTIEVQIEINELDKDEKKPGKIIFQSAPIKLQPPYSQKKLDSMFLFQKKQQHPFVLLSYNLPNEDLFLPKNGCLVKIKYLNSRSKHLISTFNINSEDEDCIQSANNDVLKKDISEYGFANLFNRKSIELCTDYKRRPFRKGMNVYIKNYGGTYFSTDHFGIPCVDVITKSKQPITNTKRNKITKLKQEIVKSGEENQIDFEVMSKMKLFLLFHKRIPKIDENVYPQSNSIELLKSCIKTLENNESYYFVSHLLTLRKGAFDEMELDKKSINNIDSLIILFKDLLLKTTNNQIIYSKINDHIIELELNQSESMFMTIVNNKWRISLSKTTKKVLSKEW